MKTFEKLLKTIFDILIIIMILLVIVVSYNFIQINIMEKKYSNFFGYTFFEVTTGSMSGTIEIDDVILVEITKDVKENDIITFEDEEGIVTHRIIKEEQDTFITKGDANNGQDKPIEKSKVIGKVIKNFSKAGIWIKVLTDIKVITCLIITILLFGLAISSEKGEKQKEKKSFSRFMRNRREKRNESKTSKEKKES